MNSSIITNGAQQLSSATTYTVLRSIREGSVPFGPAYNLPSSWKKFLNKSVFYPEAECSITAIVASQESNTAKGPAALKPQPTINDYDAKIDAFLRFLDSLESKVETMDNKN